jgi:hypothetical protein
MTQLSPEFIHRTQREPLTVTYGDRTVTLGPTARRAAGVDTELIVKEGDSVVGYITAYGDYEHGALQTRFAGVGAPVIKRTLEAALDVILS